MKRLLGIGAFLFLIVLGYGSYSLVTLPDVRPLKYKNPTVTAFMEQRAAERRRQAQPLNNWVSYESISPHLRNAVLVAEDAAFFHHSGYDIDEMKESVKRNWREGRFARGASTITQQLAKNMYLSRSKNPLRKVREFFIAQDLERHLTKRWIFEIYLNVIEWGDGIYGIGEASSTYFGKAPAEILPEEGVVLAAMIPNPINYHPSRQLGYLEKRKAELLKRLARFRYLSNEEYEAALFRPIAFRRTSESR